MTRPIFANRPVGPVERARRARGWRLKDLAAAAETSISTVSRIESGYIPARELQERIASALETAIEVLWPPADGSGATARACVDLWQRLLSMFGNQFFADRGRVGFGVLEDGRAVVLVGPTGFFEADDAIVAFQESGDRVVYGIVGDDGAVKWAAAPAGDPALN